MPGAYEPGMGVWFSSHKRHLLLVRAVDRHGDGVEVGVESHVLARKTGSVIALFVRTWYFRSHEIIGIHTGRRPMLPRLGETGLHG